MRRGAALATLMMLLAACGATPPPTPTSAPATPQLVLDSADVAGAYLLPAASVQHDGTHHLWTVVFGVDADEAPRVVHLTSTDARSWDGESAPSLLDGSELGLNDVGPIPSSVLVEDDGTWLMYGGGRTRDRDESVIWRATAPGPDGPWRIDPAPVLLPAATGWDSGIADHPSVVATDDGYLMAYGGSSATSPNRGRIGFATSPDGVTWTRSARTLEGADDADAIGPSACGIDARTMVEPELAVVEGGYRLFFGAMRADLDEMVVGLATSADGTAWSCASDGPVLTPAAFDAQPALHSYLALRADSADLLLVEVLADESESSSLWLVRP